MKKYEVRFAVPVFFCVTVEAKNEKEAEESAMQYARLDSFVGNGGDDKLVGVCDECVSIEPGEGPIEAPRWPIEVEEV